MDDTATVMALNTAHAVSPELAALRERVRALSAELAAAREAERRHLARELHDSLGAELTATRFALANVETWLPAAAPPSCTAALATARRSLDAVCEAMRDIVADLHGPLLDTGLVAALTRWSGGFAERTGLAIALHCAPDARLAHLPADAALAVFRVAQEALGNVARHAGARSAEVRLVSTPRHVKLTVGDDGIRWRAAPASSAAPALPGAIEPAGSAPSAQFGVAGMRARCEAFGGTLRVVVGTDIKGAGRTAPHGTTVHASFAWDALLAPARARSASPASSASSVSSALRRAGSRARGGAARS